MDTMTLMMPLGGLVGHGVAAFHAGARIPESFSIGDQQAEMALWAYRGVEAAASSAAAPERTELLCLHCGAGMRVLEDSQIGMALHLSAECPRCGCLRATYVELSPSSQRFLDIAQEASFD